uniref:Hematopoietic cell signal transducer n=1 Tax=Cyprinus carpio carpio TaxID=630221 RepID=A0A9J8B8Y9_CYPCA
MTKKSLLAFFSLSLLAMVSAAQDKDLCYGFGSGTIAGIIFADVAVTVLIVTITYWYASKRRQKKENGEILHRHTLIFSSNL